MKKEEAETFWMKELKESCTQAMIEEMKKRAGNPVAIFETDELNEGKMEWAVSQEDGYWMSSFKTEAEAEEFVEAMGWPRFELA